MLLLSLLSQSPLYALLFLAALLIGLTVHEFAHAWVAFLLGDATARSEGRLTLNPLAHLDPVGTIFFLLAGFGWGKPVPINPGYFKKRSDEILVALAGIVTNLLVACVLAIPLKYMLAGGASVDSSPLAMFLSLIVFINITLAVFNLLPLPPLDGSHILEYFLPDNLKYQYRLIGPYLLIGLIAMDYLSGVSIISTLIEPVVRIIGGSQIATMFFH